MRKLIFTLFALAFSFVGYAQQQITNDFSLPLNVLFLAVLYSCGRIWGIRGNFGRIPLNFTIIKSNNAKDELL